MQHGHIRRMQSPGDPLLTTASPAPADAKRVVLHAASCEDGLGGEPRHVCPLNDLPHEECA